MGILSLVKLFARFVKLEDLIAFLFSVFLGYMAASFLPDGPWPAYAFVLITYHLFLAWLVFDADQKNISLPIFSTVLTHLACLALAIVFVKTRSSIPFFGFVRVGFVGMAVFERNWIFSMAKEKTEAQVLKPAAAAAAAEVAAITSSATGDDFEAWQQYIAHRKPVSRKPGTTVQDEYNQFMVARAKARSATTAASPRA